MPRVLNNGKLDFTLYGRASSVVGSSTSKLSVQPSHKNVDTKPATNTSIENFSVIDDKIKFTKLSMVQKLPLGQLAQYRITVENPVSNEYVQNVKLIDMLQDGLTYHS